MLKLGVIDVLNVLPVYYGLLNQHVSAPCELVKGRVTELNGKLNRGEIDISAISSFEYAKNHPLYYILPDLSVSADGAVKSIYLFLDKPLDQLKNDTIHLTAFSLTSVHLIQYLLKDHAVSFTADTDIPAVGELLIADEAIQRFYEKRDAYVYDLSTLWKENTGLPFVFALWCVRKDTYEREPAAVAEIHRALIQSKMLAKQYINQMAAEKHHHIFPDKEQCAAYLRNLHYDFSAAYQEGFNLFQKEMVAIGKLDQIAPIQLIDASI